MSDFDIQTEFMRGTEIQEMEVPTMVYRRDGDHVKAKIVDGKVPKGWVTSPQEAWSGKSESVKSVDGDEFNPLSELKGIDSKDELEKLVLFATDGKVNLDKRKSMKSLKAKARAELKKYGYR